LLLSFLSRAFQGFPGTLRWIFLFAFFFFFTKFLLGISCYCSQPAARLIHQIPKNKKSINPKTTSDGSGHRSFIGFLWTLVG